MMINNAYKKGLALSIIVLFIGVGIQPAFAVDISKVRPSENIEDCDCQVTDNFDIVKIRDLLNRAERSLNRVEIFTKFITTFSKGNPEVFEVCLEYIRICQEKLEFISSSYQSEIREKFCSLLNDILVFIYDFTIRIDDILFEIVLQFPILEPLYNIFGLLFIYSMVTIWVGFFIINLLFCVPHFFIPLKICESIKELGLQLKEIRCRNALFYNK